MNIDYNERNERMWRMRNEGYMTPREIARYYRISIRRVYKILYRENKAKGTVRENKYKKCL